MYDTPEEARAGLLSYLDKITISGILALDGGCPDQADQLLEVEDLTRKAIVLHDEGNHMAAMALIQQTGPITAKVRAELDEINRRRKETASE